MSNEFAENLRDIERRFDEQTDRRVIFIHSEELPAAFWATPEEDEQLKILEDYLAESRGVELLSDKDREDILDGVNNAEPQSFRMSIKGDGGFLDRTDDACIVISAEQHLSQGHFLDDNGGYEYHSVYAPGELQIMANNHEGGHCIDDIQLETGGDTLRNIHAVHYRHKREVFSDLVGASEAIIAGYEDNALKTADVRAVSSAMRGPLNATALSEIAPLDAFDPENADAERVQTAYSGAVYYTSPALRELDRRIQEMGVDRFRTMSRDDRLGMIEEIAEENTLSPRGLIELHNFHLEGQDYKETLRAQAQEGDMVAKENLQFLIGYQMDRVHAEMRIIASPDRPSYRQELRPVLKWE